MVLKGAKNALNALAEQPGMKGAAVGTREGMAEDSAGSIDAETVCAVVAMMGTSLTDALGVLGLGEPDRWCVGGGNEYWYVLAKGSDFIVSVGGSSRNPGQTLTAADKTVKGAGS